MGGCCFVRVSIAEPLLVFVFIFFRGSDKKVFIVKRNTPKLKLTDFRGVQGQLRCVQHVHFAALGHKGLSALGCEFGLLGVVELGSLPTLFLHILLLLELVDEPGRLVGFALELGVGRVIVRHVLEQLLARLVRGVELLAGATRVAGGDDVLLSLDLEGDFGVLALAAEHILEDELVEQLGERVVRVTALNNGILLLVGSDLRAEVLDDGCLGHSE